MIACPFNPRPILLALALLAFSILGADSSETAGSGLPVPRFVSLADDRVNARAGPGFRFPINWVYLRKGFPVEVVDEFGPWRRIRDIDGVAAWIHLSMLSGKRTVIITANNPETTPTTLRRAPNKQSAPIASVEIGAHGRLLECEDNWCRIELTPYRGWLPKNVLWGVYENEQVD
ncbi:MAG: SH3 domain-containing protein [Alphaproteobacteria bacterium]